MNNNNFEVDKHNNEYTPSPPPIARAMAMDCAPPPGTLMRPWTEEQLKREKRFNEFYHQEGIAVSMYPNPNDVPADMTYEQWFAKNVWSAKNANNS